MYPYGPTPSRVGETVAGGGREVERFQFIQSISILRRTLFDQALERPWECPTLEIPSPALPRKIEHGCASKQRCGGSIVSSCSIHRVLESAKVDGRLIFVYCRLENGFWANLNDSAPLGRGEFGVASSERE